MIAGIRMPTKNPHIPPSGDPSTPQRSRSRSHQSQQETPFKGGSKKKMNSGTSPTQKSSIKDFYSTKASKDPQPSKRAEESTTVPQDGPKRTKEVVPSISQGSPANDSSNPHQQNSAVTPSPSKEEKTGVATKISTPSSLPVTGNPHSNPIAGVASVSTQETQAEYERLRLR